MSCENLGLEDVMPFGKKHKGKTIEQVYKEDVGYLVWLRHTRKTDNQDTRFFAQEVHILLDDAINNDKGLRKRFEPWGASIPLDLATAAMKAAEPMREVEYAYQGQWGAF